MGEKKKLDRWQRMDSKMSSGDFFEKENATVWDLC
jgi:hypothetical protein